MTEIDVAVIVSNRVTYLNKHFILAATVTTFALFLFALACLNALRELRNTRANRCLLPLLLELVDEKLRMPISGNSLWVGIQFFTPLTCLTGWKIQMSTFLRRRECSFEQCTIEWEAEEEEEEVIESGCIIIWENSDSQTRSFLRESEFLC